MVMQDPWKKTILQWADQQRGNEFTDPIFVITIISDCCCHHSRNGALSLLFLIPIGCSIYGSRSSWIYKCKELLIQQKFFLPYMKDDDMIVPLESHPGMNYLPNSSCDLTIGRLASDDSQLSCLPMGYSSTVSPTRSRLPFSEGWYDADFKTSIKKNYNWKKLWLVHFI